MKQNLKSPCAECPFRKDSGAGWLGGFTAQQTHNCVTSESGFACHLTRQEFEEDDMSRCVGALLYASKIGKAFRDPKIEAYRRELKSSNDMSQILDRSEFFNHHKSE